MNGGQTIEGRASFATLAPISKHLSDLWTCIVCEREREGRTMEQSIRSKLSAIDCEERQDRYIDDCDRVKVAVNWPHLAPL
jgi:hypothetical protein